MRAAIDRGAYHVLTRNENRLPGLALLISAILHLSAALAFMHLSVPPFKPGLPLPLQVTLHWETKAVTLPEQAPLPTTTAPLNSPIALATTEPTSPSPKASPKSSRIASKPATPARSGQRPGKPRIATAQQAKREARSVGSNPPDGAASPAIPTGYRASELPASGQQSNVPAYPAGGLANPKPVYPYPARRRGLEGRVVLRVTVAADGSAAAVEVASSSGHDLLDQAALRAVRDWRFVPAQRNGQSVASLIQVPITFKLE